MLTGLRNVDTLQHQADDPGKASSSTARSSASNMWLKTTGKFSSKEETNGRTKTEQAEVLHEPHSASSVVRKPGHMASACSSSESLCFNCGKPGHRKADCTAPPNQRAYFAKDLESDEEAAEQMWEKPRMQLLSNLVAVAKCG